MDDNKQKKIDQIADDFKDQLTNHIDYGDHDDKLLLSAYKNDRGYSDSLASFLSAAQIRLASRVDKFNNFIKYHEKMKPSTQQSILNGLEKVLKTLEDFCQSIDAETCYKLQPDEYFQEEQIKGALDVLRNSTSSKIPSSTNQFNVYNFKSHPMFAVEPDVKTKERNEHKLYTVFVSSTYKDMKDIRKAVLTKLNSSRNYIPIGMEDFTASDSNQLNYISDRLKDTDIYVLILGGKYGTLTPEDHMSYTQKEYEMAMQDPNIMVLSFVCKNPEDLPAKRRWQNDEEHKHLEEFRQKVLNSGKLVKLWEANDDDCAEHIAFEVYRSLILGDKDDLRGWIRGVSAHSR